MITIKLLEFGNILTGREKGKGVMALLESRIPSSSELIEFDLDGVISMGSSFGDEIFPKIASRQGGTVQVRNANPSIKHCLALVAQDARIKIEQE